MRDGRARGRRLRLGLVDLLAGFSSSCLAHRSLYPGNAALGAIDDPGLTTQVHEAIGTDLAALGINVDLAPCVDVLDGAENPAIGTRSFGADPALVSRPACRPRR